MGSLHSDNATQEAAWPARILATPSFLAYHAKRAGLELIGTAAVLLGLSGIADAGVLLLPRTPATVLGLESLVPFLELGAGLVMSAAACAFGSHCIDKAERMPPVSPLRRTTRATSGSAILLRPADRPASDLQGALLRPASASSRTDAADLLLPDMEDRRLQSLDEGSAGSLPARPQAELRGRAL
jgi:hypothetical protein